MYCLRLGKGDSNLAQTASEECHVYSTIIRGEHLMKQVVPEAEAKRVTDKAKRKVGDAQLDLVIGRHYI